MQPIRKLNSQDCFHSPKTSRRYKIIDSSETMQFMIHNVEIQQKSKFNKLELKYRENVTGKQKINESVVKHLSVHSPFSSFR